MAITQVHVYSWPSLLPHSPKFFIDKIQSDEKYENKYILELIKVDNMEM